MGTWDFTFGLIVCPLVVAPIWDAALKEYGYGTIDLFSGPTSRRIARLQASCRSVAVQAATRTVGVVNYDVLGNLGTALTGKALPQALIGDESHLLKSPSTRRGKAFRKLAWKAKYVRLLTGTPAPNHYGDLWGQMVALDKAEWGTFEGFARRYLIRDTMFPSKVLGHRNVDELQERILRYASIVRREDAFGPDQWQYVRREIELPPAAREMYRHLATMWILKEPDITATHVLTRLIRLQQMASGFLKGDDGKYVEVHDGKVRAVEADLGEIVASGEKAVIFHRFRWESTRYEALARQFCPTMVINGDTPVEARAAVLRAFEQKEGPQVAVVQVQSGGVGISLAEATHALVVSRGFSFVDDEQSRDRIYKRDARRCVTYYEATGTVDEFIARTLAGKKDVHESIRGADREQLVFGYIKRPRTHTG